MRSWLAPLLLLLTTPLLGAEPSIDIEKMTQAQIGKLDAYVVMRHITKDVPVTNQFNADAFTTSLIKKHMAMLMYPVDMSTFNGPDKDSKLREQIKELQKRMGVAQTGTLLQEQLETLTRAANTLSERRVYPPPGLYVLGSRTEIRASGTWVMDDDAFPVNYSKITCVQSTQTCTDISVSVITPYQVNSDPDFNLSLSTTEYKVVAWGDNEVTASRDTVCRRERLTINASNKQAFQITTDKTSEPCILPTGEKLPLLGKPRISALGDGFIEPKKFYDQRQKQAQKLLYEPATKALGRW